MPFAYHRTVHFPDTDAAGVVHHLECEDGAPALVWTRQTAEDERRRVTVRTLAQLADVRAEMFA